MSDSVLNLFKSLALSCESLKGDASVDAESLINHCVKDVVTILEADKVQRNI